MHDEMCNDIILKSLPKSYDEFVRNFCENALTPSLPELLNILRVEESSRAWVKATQSVKTSPSSSKGGKKCEKSQQSKAAKEKAKGKDKVQKKKGVITCFHCGNKGHTRGQCHKFIAHIATFRQDSIAVGIPGVFLFEKITYLFNLGTCYLKRFSHFATCCRSREGIDKRA